MATVLVALAAGCGGGDGGPPATVRGARPPPAVGAVAAPGAVAASAAPGRIGLPWPCRTLRSPTAAEAGGVLVQASFGPTDADPTRVVELGFGGWLDEQFDKPQTLRRETLPAGGALTQRAFLCPWWPQPARGDEALHQRAAWALALLFAASTRAGAVAPFRHGAAACYAMLGVQAFGNVRDLPQAGTLHPRMRPVSDEPA